MRLAKRYRVRHGELPITALIVHPQMRLTIDEEGITQLADNILHHGLIHPLCVAETKEGYALISGHRRLKACALLKERGHDVDTVAVVIFENLTPPEMALLQASENIHEQVPAHEAAKFYEATWRLLKICEPAFTLADFARAVGRSEHTIRNALGFMLLPERIRYFVSARFLPYGAALQLVRLEGCLDAAGMEQWAVRAVSGKKKVVVADIRAQVDTHLKDMQSGQLSLLNLFEENARTAFEKASRRALIDRCVIRAFWDAMGYCERLLDLFEEGKLGANDSPWLRRNPRSTFRALIALEKRILQHIRVVLSSDEAHAAERVLEQCERCGEPENADALRVCGGDAGKGGAHYTQAGFDTRS